MAGANPGLEKIFDAEKERNRLKAAQLIAEIGSQVGDIARTEGQIAGEKAKRDPQALQAAREQLAGSGKPFTDADVAKQAYNNAMAPFGTGSSLQQGIQAATAAVQGLAGGNVGAAVIGAASPYIADIIGRSTLDPAGKIMAHAAVNAALAAAQGNGALAGAAGAATAEMAGMIALEVYGKSAGELSETEKQTVTALATLAAGLAGGLAGDSTADAMSGAQAGQTTVENNYLSSKQIDAWSAEMKQCKAGGGDCGGIVTKYEELSTAQQKQLISDCATSPATCQQKYGEVLADSMAVKQALDRAMGEDIPIKMVYDLTATWAHQMDADGIVASNKVSEQIMAKYGLDQVQADIIAGVALSALGGVSKAGKPKY